MPLPTCTNITLLEDKFSSKELNQQWNLSYLVIFDTNQAMNWDAQWASFGGVSIPLRASIVEITYYTFGGSGATSTAFFIVTESTVSRHMDDTRAFNVEIIAVPYIVANETKPDGTGVQWRIQISCDPILYKEEIFVDLSSSPKDIVIPGTKEPVVPPIMKEYYDQDLNLSYRTDQLPYSAWDACEGNVNSESITMTIKGQSRTFAQYTLKCTAPRHRVVYEQSAQGLISAWDVELRLQYRKDTWITSYQPKSLFHQDATSGKVVQNLIRGCFRPINRPMYLNAAGTDYVDPGDPLPPPVQYWSMLQASFSGLLSGLMTIS